MLLNVRFVLESHFQDHGTVIDNIPIFATCFPTALHRSVQHSVTQAMGNDEIVVLAWILGRRRKAMISFKEEI